MRATRPVWGLGLLALSITLWGCSQGQVVTELPPQEQNLRYLVMAYTQAATDLGHSPSSAEELKPFLKDFGDAETLLKSPRDGQPYVIVGGLDRAAAAQGGPSILAYEREGVNGVRKAVDMRMVVRDLSAEEFAKLGLAAGP